MVVYTWNNSVRSLFSLAVENVMNNLSSYLDGNNDPKTVAKFEFLPFPIKDRILRIFLSSLHFRRNTNVHVVLNFSIHSKTTVINLTGICVDDQILKILQKSVNLRKLHLIRGRDAKCTPNGLANLFRCLPKLCLLVITDCDQFDDGALKSLSENCPQLAALDLSGCRSLTDDGVKNLINLKHLAWLSLSRTQITDESVLVLCTSSIGRQLKELRVDNCLRITDNSLRIIAEHCPNIECLVFYDSNAKGRGEALSLLQDTTFKNLKQLTWTVTW